MCVCGVDGWMCTRIYLCGWVHVCVGVVLSSTCQEQEYYVTLDRIVV